MAYPFPRFSSAPQTPHPFNSVESPRETKSPTSRARKPLARLAFVAAFTLIALTWLVRHLVASSKQPDRIPFSHNAVEDYFNHFEGHQDCGIASTDLYVPPSLRDKDGHQLFPYCKNRATLLEAMSGGGRHGFDTPFHPAGCHYRWYSTAEICMILERFDAIIFIGDGMLGQIYAAFNMLLRENIAIGGLKQWEMKGDERVTCRCDNQNIRPECAKHTIMESQDVRENDGASGHKSPYYCDRTPHMFLPISESPAADDVHEKFMSLLTRHPDSYKPVPVILSLSLSTSLSWPVATASMNEWVPLADSSTKNVPFLWVGPNAAGHLKPPGQILQQGNNALWHYTIEMAKEAMMRELDALGMYNLTLQAASWDGSNYGQRVTLVQAMMIINWLSRLDST